MSKPHIIVIVGPTAVGKTALAIQIAKFFRTEIISADSRQFYREMTIGTAKPTTQELQAVPHHFINSHSIHQPIDAGLYEQEAENKLADLTAKYQQVVVCGGSGLYIKALLEGLDELPPANRELRDYYNKLVKNEQLNLLQEELKQVDPVYYNQVDINNPVRLIRALEIFHMARKPYSELRGLLNNKKLPYKITKIGLEMERKLLYNRINSRIDTMLSGGLIEEVRSLHPFKDLLALKTVGYQEVFPYLDGIHDYSEMERLLKLNSRRYAKRQMTWFRKDKEIHWFQPHETNEILSFISSQSDT